MKGGMHALLLAATAALIAPQPAQAVEAASGPAAVKDRAPLPSILTAQQRLDYAAIFSAIRAEDWAGASAKLDAIGDGPLTAIARAELFLAKGSPKVELEPILDLLARAPEIPQAPQLERLAELRGALDLPVLPQIERLTWADGQPRRSRAKSVKNDGMAAELEALVQPLIRDNQPAEAEAFLTEREYLLTPEAITEYQQRIGWSYYIVGDDASARRLADKARAGIGEWTLPAEWLAGLAAWRQHDCEAAGRSFDTVSTRAADLELSAAGHFWAARADMTCRHPERVQAHLRTAARMPETFYGMLATTALGVSPATAAKLHDFHDAEWRKLLDRPNVRAAIALVEIGERELADEIIKHQCKIDSSGHEALIHLASDLNLPSTQIWLAHNVPIGKRVDMAARYPAPDWRPSGGWRVDPSLVLAHTLQESGFRTSIVSSAGAVGLMQVRPGTAGDMAKVHGEAFDSRQLTDASTNFEYGQRYLEYLRDNGGTGGLLLKVIAAYNAGPVPVTEWNLREFDGGDPLLYVESIPYWETRAYVPTILRNYWIYEQESGRQRSPTREALVQGLWSRFPSANGATPALRIAPRTYAVAQRTAEAD